MAKRIRHYCIFVAAATAIPLSMWLLVGTTDWMAFVLFPVMGLCLGMATDRHRAERTL